MNESYDKDDRLIRVPKHRCKRCRGTGQVPGVKKTTKMGKGMGSQYGTCPECDGEGWIYEESINQNLDTNESHA